MDSFMKRAVELAAENVKNGGQPFGAVLVKDSRIIAEGVNELHKKHDISAHAEMLAIRRAQEKLATNNLAGYAMYASGEPCPMCFAAMYFAGITDAFYCVPVEEAADAGLATSGLIYKDLKKSKEERTLSMVHMPLDQDQENPLILWKKWTKEKS
ncbi:nucleoside deaminase [Pseudobacillus badius]|uniref:nucleoside deaminase n=1 Tax=Bacillus badius TaxID=1455 RepID=UPI0007B073DE|nr:nucleoside deaminase [Bacillus badius]KZO00343.1 tRNA-specific adenosine deaminase [Bacillus badius]OCS86510.1 tRNA-specific adenosine deaminase [Bacillus badius]OVE52026.1 tRNA-specific adenosine deaminase [Bacillus badius]TDW03724.1 tRNA(Arg) A34 adenosine deaminase TadA [Bacillus badius]UAT30160.1 nucleoside deaminase [Bacillus badius]